MAQMNDEYDFPNAEKSKFYEYIARRKGTDISVVVNEILKADRALARALQ